MNLILFLGVCVASMMFGFAWGKSSGGEGVLAQALREIGLESIGKFKPLKIAMEELKVKTEGKKPEEITEEDAKELQRIGTDTDKLMGRFQVINYLTRAGMKSQGIDVPDIE